MSPFFSVVGWVIAISLIMGVAALWLATDGFNED